MAWFPSAWSTLTVFKTESSFTESFFNFIYSIILWPADLVLTPSKFSALKPAVKLYWYNCILLFLNETSVKPMQTYPGVAVILYLTTEDSPFSPQMRARTGLGVITGSLLNSGVFSTTGRSPSSLSSAALKFERCHFKPLIRTWVLSCLKPQGLHLPWSSSFLFRISNTTVRSSSTG